MLADPPPPGEGDDCTAEPHVASSANLEADPTSLAPRLQSAVARVLPAIEATLAKLAAGPQRPRELEQTARALGALMRTLRELNALLAQQPPRAALDDDMPENIDEFRFELARRIRAFVSDRTARRNAEAAEAAAQALDDDDIPEDIDAFREQLAQKIEAFMESRGDEEFEEDEPATCPGPAGRA
jgi:hypothetical protein